MHRRFAAASAPNPTETRTFLKSPLPKNPSLESLISLSFVPSSYVAVKKLKTDSLKNLFSNAVSPRSLSEWPEESHLRTSEMIGGFRSSFEGTKRLSAVCCKLFSLG